MKDWAFSLLSLHFDMKPRLSQVLANWDLAKEFVENFLDFIENFFIFYSPASVQSSIFELGNSLGIRKQQIQDEFGAVSVWSAGWTSGCLAFLRWVFDLASKIEDEKVEKEKNWRGNHKGNNTQQQTFLCVLAVEVKGEFDIFHSSFGTFRSFRSSKFTEMCWMKMANFTLLFTHFSAPFNGRVTCRKGELAKKSMKFASWWNFTEECWSPMCGHFSERTGNRVNGRRRNRSFPIVLTRFLFSMFWNARKLEIFLFFYESLIFYWYFSPFAEISWSFSNDSLKRFQKLHLFNNIEVR